MARPRKQDQTCKNCGNADGLNFNVADALWERVVPQRLLNRVVCLSCFDRMASKRGIEYRRHIRVLHFAGQSVGFKFHRVRSS